MVEKFKVSKEAVKTSYLWFTAFFIYCVYISIFLKLHKVVVFLYYFELKSKKKFLKMHTMLQKDNTLRKNRKSEAVYNEALRKFIG